MKYFAKTVKAEEVTYFKNQMYMMRTHGSTFNKRKNYSLARKERPK